MAYGNGSKAGYRHRQLVMAKAAAGALEGISGARQSGMAM